jgi:hypothetical protein
MTTDTSKYFATTYMEAFREGTADAARHALVPFTDMLVDDIRNVMNNSMTKWDIEYVERAADAWSIIAETQRKLLRRLEGMAPPVGSRHNHDGTWPHLILRFLVDEAVMEAEKRGRTI